MQDTRGKLREKTMVMLIVASTHINSSAVYYHSFTALFYHVVSAISISFDIETSLSPNT